MANELKTVAAPEGAGPVQAVTRVCALDPTRHGEATREFEMFLRNRIVGQDAAIEAVTNMYQMVLVGMAAPDRPIGNLLFLGPTGSGKTYVVEVVAEALFGNPHSFIKVDCAEFQQPHEIAKLIGSPPGYIGHKETPPMLSQEALAQWHTDKLKLSLVLFDEVEKASEALWQLLLGILDRAALTLGDNRHVDLSQCMIFMTSNLGATEMSHLAQGGMGFAVRAAIEDASLDEKIAGIATEAARRKFSPEFMNRLDKVVVFNTLRPEHLEKILELELAKVQQRITQAAGQSHFTFRCSPEVKRWLLQEGTDARYGARHLKRVIERNIVYALANLVATNQVAAGDCIDVGLQSDGLAFSKAETVVSQASVAD
ncbi:MAG TPA: AAA family ATPase [Terriglobales bacterium]|jgi:ATP-dependent Clp protease ATP-binding subunit ClpB|nr:AAA family ATPase [Terriglobales bacterium]